MSKFYYFHLHTFISVYNKYTHDFWYDLLSLLEQPNLLNK